MGRARPGERSSGLAAHARAPPRAARRRRACDLRRAARQSSGIVERLLDRDEIGQLRRARSPRASREGGRLHRARSQQGRRMRQPLPLRSMRRMRGLSARLLIAIGVLAALHLAVLVTLLIALDGVEDADREARATARITLAASSARVALASWRPQSVASSSREPSRRSRPPGRRPPRRCGSPPTRSHVRPNPCAELAGEVRSYRDPPRGSPLARRSPERARLAVAREPPSAAPPRSRNASIASSGLGAPSARRSATVRRTLPASRRSWALGACW